MVTGATIRGVPARPTRPRPQHARARQAPPAPRWTAGRPVFLRVNRLTNGIFIGVELALALFFFGVERSMSTNDGLVFVAIAIVIGVGVGRRLRPGRLLTLEVSAMEARVTNAFAPQVVIHRNAALRAVIWVARRYGGAEPALRGLYLVDHDGVRAFSRPMTFSADQVKRFFDAAAIPVEVVDAAQPPFAA